MTVGLSTCGVCVGFGVASDLGGLGLPPWWAGDLRDGADAAGLSADADLGAALFFDHTVLDACQRSPSCVA